MTSAVLTHYQNVLYGNEQQGYLSISIPNHLESRDKAVSNSIP